LTPVNPFLFADRYLSVCFGGKKYVRLVRTLFQ
jgi:hypothetical protein